MVKQSGVVSSRGLARTGWYVFPIGLIAAFLGLAAAREFGQPSALNYTYVGLMSAAIVCIGLEKNAVLAFAPPRFLGTISYGLYLFHPIVIEAVRARRGNAAVMAGVAVAVSVGVAALSRYWVEGPLIAFGKSVGIKRTAETGRVFWRHKETFYGRDRTAIGAYPN